MSPLRFPACWIAVGDGDDFRITGKNENMDSPTTSLAVPVQLLVNSNSTGLGKWVWPRPLAEIQTEHESGEES